MRPYRRRKPVPRRASMLDDYEAQVRAWLDALGWDPVSVSGKIAGIGRIRLQHAQRAAAAGEDRADRDGGFEADPEMARAGSLGVAE